jgi:hypothetical protein
MTTIARTAISTSATYAPPLKRSYAHAHWYFLASFLVIVAGFWPTFFQPMGSGATMKNLHGVTSSLWYFGLMAQSWLMSRGLVTWHRRTAIGMIVLLPILAVSALSNTSTMLTTSQIAAEGRPFVAFMDFQLVAQLLVFVGLGLKNRRTPSAHKRYMAATALVGFGPALARLYGRLHFQIGGPINAPTITQNLILLTMIVVDWRNGEGKRRAYPLMIVWNLAIQALIVPLPTTGAWVAFCRWFAASP